MKWRGFRCLPILDERFVRDVLWNVSALGILGVSGMLINTLILGFRDSQALGVFGQVFAFYIITAQFATGGMQFSVLKHCSHVRLDAAQCGVIASSAMLLVGLTSGVTCAAGYVAAAPIARLLDSPQVQRGIVLALPGLFFFSLNKVQLMVLNGLRHMRSFAVFQVVRYVMILAGITAIMLAGSPASLLPLALSIAECVLFVALLVYTRRCLCYLSWPLAREARVWFSRHLSFGARGFLSGILVETNTRIDALMIAYFMSDKSVGIYCFAAVFAEGLAQLSIVVRQNIDPVAGRCFAAGSIQDLQTLADSIRGKFFAAMALLGMLLIAGFPILSWALAGQGEHFPAWVVLTILVTAYVLASRYMPFASLLLQGDRPGAFSIIMAGAVVANVVLNAVLVPLIGIYGAALATGASCLAQSLAIAVMVRRYFKVRL